MKKNRAVSLVLAALSLTLVFFGGSILSNTRFEKLAEYATEIVVNHTSNKKFCAITVEASGDSGSIIDSETEFHRLYGVFRQQKITFASGMNADKKHNITFGDFISDNLSVLYVGPVGTIEYNGHYKHYISPMEMMFLDERNYDLNKYVVYISQTHADKILDLDPNFNRDENNLYNSSDYKSLLKRNIPIYIDGIESNILIQNIYYQSNYYYEGLHEVMGDFVISSYYFPQNLRSEQQNIYFLSEYTYQNNYFMNYINSAYSSKKYLVKINKYNVVGEIDETYFLGFYYSDDISKLDWLSTLIFIVSGFMILGSALIHIYQNKILKNKNIIWTIFNIMILFVPYLLFKIIFVFSNNVMFFSATSGKIYIWFVAAYILIMAIALSGFRINIFRKCSSGGELYDINI